MKVLIVDDEILVRKGISMGVDWESLGFDEVKEASNGVDAFEYAKENYPELVLTDIKMPKMDGLELIEKLKHYCPDTIVIVLSCVDDTDYVRRSMQFGGAIDYILKLSLSTDDLYEIVKKAKKLIKNKSRSRPIEIEEEPITAAIGYGNMTKNDEKNILDSLQICDRKALIKHVITLIIREYDQGISIKDFVVSQDILGLINSEIRRRNGDINSIKIHGLHPYIYIKESQDIGELEQRFILLVNLIISYLKDIQSKNYSECISTAVLYIHNHYMENLTLSKMGSVVNLNTAYFSRKFKEETGINFIDYINQIRIDKAKHLLEEKALPIYEIARLVGYSNDTYFSRMFKASVGICPKKYQKKYQK